MLITLESSSHLLFSCLLCCELFAVFNCTSSRLWSVASVSTAVKQVPTVASAQDNLCSPTKEEKHLPQCKKEPPPPQERPGQLNTSVLGVQHPNSTNQQGFHCIGNVPGGWDYSGQAAFSVQGQLHRQDPYCSCYNRSQHDPLARLHPNT